MPRGRAWTQAEVGSLLALVGGSGEAALLMASTSRPNEALWQEISRGLAAAGYGRSVAQCRSKWKALKQAFHSERETRRRAGRHSPRLPPHYRAMKSIWKAAGRPVFGERRLPELVKPPPRRRRSLAARSPTSPAPPAAAETPAVLLAPLLQHPKDEPASRKYRPAPPRRAARPPLQLKPVPACWDGGVEGVGGPRRGVFPLGCSRMGFGELLHPPPPKFGSKPTPQREGLGPAGVGQEGESVARSRPRGTAGRRASEELGLGVRAGAGSVPVLQRTRTVPRRCRIRPRARPVRAGEGSGCCSPSLLAHRQGSGPRGGTGETPPQKQEQRRARRRGSPGCCFIPPPGPAGAGERTPASRPASAPGNYVVSLNSPCSFKWMWDSPSLPVLICCVAWPRAATQLLPSSPEVAALQWWPAGTASLEHRPTPRPPHVPAAASLPIPSWAATAP
nr:serine/arginine repetitive matrix protein 1-like isoform X2 [Anser cygnoides]